MFITPMEGIQPLKDIEDLGKRQETGNPAALPFQDIFENAINNVVTTEQDYAQKQYLLATGQLDDVHTLPIAQTKAETAVDLLVQLRTKALEAYNELMRLSV